MTLRTFTLWVALSALLLAVACVLVARPGATPTARPQPRECPKCDCGCKYGLRCYCQWADQ